MGFKEAFTRQGEGEDLIYDDGAFYYFALSLLTIILLPLIYSLLKPLFTTYLLKSDSRKFTRVPKAAQDQANLRLIQAQRRHNWLTCGYFFKIILALFFLYLFQLCLFQLPNADKIKGFDPYEILEVPITATDVEIKKAYRRISLKLHPDKNPDDPQASSKFILATKAYESLIDPEKRELYEKYGNPDGKQTISVGVALPSVLLKKENRTSFLALIFLVLLVVVPVIVLNELKSIGKVDENGILLSNFGKFELQLEENITVQKCLKVVVHSEEILKVTAKASEQYDLNKLAVELRDEAEIRKIQNFEISEAIELSKKTKGQRRAYALKGLVLTYAHLFGKKIPESLVEDYRKVITLMPKLLSSMVIFALEFSKKEMVMLYRARGRRQTRFMGFRCINNLIMSQQCIVQGLHEFDPPINQIAYFATEARNHIKKGKMPAFLDLVGKPRESRSLPNWIPEEYRDQIQEEIEMFPRIEVSHELVIDDETLTEMCTEDLVMLKIAVTRINTPEKAEAPFVHSNRFTYIQEEGWYVILSSEDQVYFLQRLTGPERTKKAEFRFVPSKLAFQNPTNIEVTLSVISDSYRGLDFETQVKMSFKPASETNRKIEFHKEDEELDKSLPFMQQILNPLNGQANPEDSDDEQEPHEATEKATKKKPKQEKNEEEAQIQQG